MQRMKSLFAALSLTAFLGLMAAPIVASASEEGHKNTAIGLGAASAALLLTQKNKLPGILAAGGAAYAYGQSQRSMNARHRRERAYAYRTGYHRGSSYARYHRHHRAK